jgi:hypothetical protein
MKLLGVLMALGVSGCATQTRSVALGGGIGVGAGAIAGGLADPGRDGEYRTRNVAIGSAVGGAAGVLSGALLHDLIEEKKAESHKQGEAKGKTLAPASGTQPPLEAPQVEAQWVEARVTGNRYIEGHYEYVIVSPARWEGN